MSGTHAAKVKGNKNQGLVIVLWRCERRERAVRAIQIAVRAFCWGEEAVSRDRGTCYQRVTRKIANVNVQPSSSIAQNRRRGGTLLGTLSEVSAIICFEKGLLYPRLQFAQIWRLLRAVISPGSVVHAASPRCLILSGWASPALRTGGAAVLSSRCEQQWLLADLCYRRPNPKVRAGGLHRLFRPKAMSLRLGTRGPVSRCMQQA